jgi:hypothetical protein
VSDDNLIGVCRDEARVLVTLDLDFSNVLRFPPALYMGIAVLRVTNPVELSAMKSGSESCSKAPRGKSLQEGFGSLKRIASGNTIRITNGE